MAKNHDHAIERSREAFEADNAVLALWLEGSLAAGDGDDWSDVDLHLAVKDEAFDEFTTDYGGLLRRIGEPISFIEAPLPTGRLLAATVTSPPPDHLVRIDLCIERRSEVATVGRRDRPLVIFDWDSVADSLSECPELTFDARAQVAALMRGYFFGAMWPARMMGRRDWISLAFNDVSVVTQFLVPLALINAGSPEFHREPAGRARFLPPEQRHDLEGFLGRLFEALRGIDAGAPNLDALADVHVELLSRCLRGFREACASTGLPYPEEAASAYRAFYEQAMGRTVPL